MTAKKNQQQTIQRLSKDKQINRPSINGPSLLKNKSFIYTNKNDGKQNSFMHHRPSHDGFKAPYFFFFYSSIDSI